MLPELNSIRINSILFTDKEIDELSTYISLKDDESWEHSFAKLLKSLRDDNDDIIVNTSGSTDLPKNIKLKKSHLINSAKQTIDFFKLTSDSTIVCCLPTQYIGGIMMIVRAFVCKCNLILAKPKANPVSDLIENIDLISMTPYQFSHSISDFETKNNIKNILLGGSPLNTSSIESIKKISANVYHSYGMTETCSHIALRNCKTEQFFKPLNNIKISTNENNCLVIDAPHLASSVVTTNDIVEINKDGSFTIIGRIDNIINSGGIKIQPEFLERKLSNHINKPFFISSIPDATLGQKVVMIVKDTSNTSSLKQIERSINDNLLVYERPKEIFFTNNFHFTETNKIDRRKTLCRFLEDNED